MNIHSLRAAAVGVLVLFSVSLTACTQSPFLPTSTASSASGSMTQASSSTTPESQIASALVNLLRSKCSNLSDYLGAPSTWHLTKTSPTTAPFEMYASGDGGTPVVNVTPTGASATVTISNANATVTNVVLWNMGCTSIATNPGGSSASGNNQNGGSTSSQQLAPPPPASLTMPNVVGMSESSALMTLQMATKATVSSVYTGTHVSVNQCQSLHNGKVTAQSISYGTSIKDSPSTQIVLSVAC